MVTLDDLYIQTKDETLVKFAPNAVQRLYLDQILPRWESGEIDAKGLREIVLKARQFGFSTLIAALFFLRAVNNTDINVVIMADASDNSELLFQKVKLFWEMLPEDKRPRTRYNSRRELYFPDLRSRISVLTAGKKGAGRSRTIHCLHGSEIGFWPNPKILTGLLQAVPMDGSVFLESTANGESGDGEVFCTEYREAAAGRRSYQARFFAWWSHEDYQREPGPDFTRTDDEITIANKYELDRRFGAEVTNRKLAWRRVKEAEPGMGSLLPQEYPGDSEEAFLVSGTRFFRPWNPDRHVVHASEIAVESWWQPLSGYDWGFGAPASGHLAFVDDYGDILIVDEVYGPDRLDPVQAADMVAMFSLWHVKPGDVPVYADPAMWAQKADNRGKRFSNVSAFRDEGLNMIKASNARIPGWQLFLRYLSETTKRPGKSYPRLRVSSKCQNLIRIMPLMIRAKNNPEDMESDAALVEDHAADDVRYMLTAVPLPVEKPREEIDPDLMPRWMRERETPARL